MAARSWRFASARKPRATSVATSLWRTSTAITPANPSRRRCRDSFIRSAPERRLCCVSHLIAFALLRITLRGHFRPSFKKMLISMASFLHVFCISHLFCMVRQWTAKMLSPKWRKRLWRVFEIDALPRFPSTLNPALTGTHWNAILTTVLSSRAINERKLLCIGVECVPSRSIVTRLHLFHRQSSDVFQRNGSLTPLIRLLVVSIAGIAARRSRPNVWTVPTCSRCWSRHQTSQAA